MENNNTLFGQNILNHTDGSSCIIAEAGINHDGHFDKARKLIDIAAKAKCTCVKFQTVNTDKTLSVNAISASYIEKGSKEGETFYQLGKRLELSYDEQGELFNYSKLQGIPFISSHFDETSLEFLVELGVPVLKVASGELTNFPLLKKAANTGLPMIVSTGMADIEEIDEVYNFLKGHGVKQLFLMHCVSWYPAKVDMMNIRVIDTLFEKYNIPVGLSDHTIGISVATGARARGVKLFEKHFTFSKKDFGPDHSTSLETDELAQMVISIDEVGRSLGNERKIVSPIELEQRKVHRKSVVALMDIKDGDILSEEMLCIKKPGYGIPPSEVEKIVGYTSVVAIQKDEVITWDMIQQNLKK